MEFYWICWSMKYKRSVVRGLIHRIFRACSNFKTLSESLHKAKSILEKNQYPKSFVDSIIKETLDKLLGTETVREKEKHEEFDLKIQYSQVLDEFIKSKSRHPVLLNLR